MQHKVRVVSGRTEVIRLSYVVSQLHGVIATHGADQGLLVAWGGLTRQAQGALQNNKLRVRVWQAADVVDAVLSNYERLPAEIRDLPAAKNAYGCFRTPDPCYQGRARR